MIARKTRPGKERRDHDTLMSLRHGSTFHLSSHGFFIHSPTYYSSIWPSTRLSILSKVRYITCACELTYKYHDPEAYVFHHELYPKLCGHMRSTCPIAFYFMHVCSFSVNVSLRIGWETGKVVEHYLYTYISIHTYTHDISHFTYFKVLTNYIGEHL